MTSLTTPQQLVEAGFAPAQDPWLDSVADRYAIGVPSAWTDRLADHPSLARQVLPDAHELEVTATEQDDPIGDDPHSPLDGLIHRYPDRALLKIVSVCALYCRFCFRRTRVGPGQGAMTPEQLERALAYISEHSGIWEVILSGGDPLMLPADKLADAIKKIAAIDHVKVLRLHSRIPVAAPERVTSDLVQALKHDNLTTVLAVHSNHADEFSDDAICALERLTSQGIPLVGQTVLLKGVNADVETLEHLFRTMVVHRIMPYYLHHPDLAPGTGHFRCSLDEGQALMQQLRGRVSGIALPTYMLDIPGGHGKVPVGPSYVARNSEAHLVTDVNGHAHAYPPDQAHG